MKLRVSPLPLPHYSNRHRHLPCHALHRPRRHGLLIPRTHLSRRKLRMTHPIHSRKWGIFLLHLPLFAHRARPLLRLIPLPSHMKHWRCDPPPTNNNCLRGLRSSLRSNILLRGYCHYQPPLCHSLHWHYPSPMNLRGLLSR